MTKTYKGYIGVFDSGVGGISVLREATALLPHENFYYYGDSAHAPYGEKSSEEVLSLISDAVEQALDKGIKAAIIACNTATSVAVSILRETYPDIPFIGIEPAVKPAALSIKNGKILVMATPRTLEENKFHELARRFESDAEIIPLPCPGLAARIEKGNLESSEVYSLIESFVGAYKGKVDGVVLGCTHYPFIKKQIQTVLGDIPFFDGGAGTARELKHQLEERGLLSQSSAKGAVCFDSSNNTPGELALYRRFYEMPL
ncbi:MAG: glutamate racemase [Eggerthellaceae bacterium]|jgi:glutamate racemase